MAAPTNQKLTPQATVTVSESYTTDTSSEFWQLVAGNKFIVYEGVPLDLMQNILQSNDPDNGDQDATRSLSETGGLSVSHARFPHDDSTLRDLSEWHWH
jgi:hypothetical protein